MRGSSSRAKLVILFLLLFAGSPAWAAVEIAFYSRELGANNFPHAFVTMKGTVDSTGERVDTAVGFTARSVTPAILLGSVTGQVIVETPNYIARSERQFALTVTDDQYRMVAAVVERWRNTPQPSYNLNRRNCVHFVGEVAQAAGLSVTFNPRLMRRPRSFLISVREANIERLSPAIDQRQPA